eukprot:CAMPEP_0179917870 /NCGR_PEP_ID=MMETSP0983-20121128/3079_1 /TAXON_ID=483367 /ORGANISM="non described non described, Strain CCMP 2436" /LENGTH=79 /DNA_ID=CAMNT_0021820665 /DNA_START=632 /DNA_END=871 /DNA_ORIENTATION=+
MRQVPPAAVVGDKRRQCSIRRRVVSLRRCIRMHVSDALQTSFVQYAHQRAARRPGSINAEEQRRRAPPQLLRVAHYTIE